MSRKSPQRIPSYRHHKPSDQAVVTINGRDFYLGPWRSEVSKAEYERLVGEWLANSRQLPDSGANAPKITVDELMAAYWRHASGYYLKNGVPTSELGFIRLALRPLRQMYGHTAAAGFGPVALKAVREKIVATGIRRRYANGQVGRIKRTFRWGVENELVPANVFHGLQAVTGLRKGRSAAKESRKVRPVGDDRVEAVKPFVSSQVRAMIELQRLTGMRSGEIVILRGCDVDMTARIWCYTLPTHKTEHFEQGEEDAKKVHLGPRAQEVLKPFLKGDPQAYIFSPAEAEAARNLTRQAARRLPRWPSHDPDLRRARRGGKRHRHQPRDRYTVKSYHRAIHRACDHAFPLTARMRRSP